MHTSAELSLLPGIQGAVLLILEALVGDALPIATLGRCLSVAQHPLDQYLNRESVGEIWHRVALAGDRSGRVGELSCVVLGAKVGDVRVPELPIAPIARGELVPVGDPTRGGAAPDCVLDLVLPDTADAAYDGDRKGTDAQGGMEVGFGTVTLGVSNPGGGS